MTASENTVLPKTPVWKRFLPLGILAAIIITVFATGAHRYLSPKALVENYTVLNGAVEANLIIALLAYMGIYAVATAVSLPGALVLTVAGGLLFGGLIGGLATVTGATLGATVIYLIACSSLGASLRQKAGPLVAKMQKGFQEDAINYMLFLRLVPLFPFWLVNLAPALLGVALLPYVLTTFIGIIPGTLAYSYAGAGIKGIVEAQAAELDACRAAATEACTVSLGLADLVNKDMLIAFAALGLVALIPVLAKKFFKRKK